MSPVKRVGMILVAVSALCSGAPVLMATDRYVPNGGEPHYSDIQAAIDACEIDAGDRVIVQSGVYTGLYGFYNLDFHGKKIVVKSLTDNPADCTLDCDGVLGRRGFTFHTGETSASVLRGFTIKKGNINPGYGGAILCENGSSPKIVNCAFNDNQAGPPQTLEAGGAIACLSGGSPVIANCLFSGNQAVPGFHGAAGRGGALYCGPLSQPVIVNCTFENNSAVGEGGAIYLDTSDAILMRCQIKGNRSMVVGSGRAVYCTQSSPTIVNCLITENDDYPPLNPTYYGGAIVCDYGSTAILTNCTVADNLAAAGSNDQGGGLLCTGGSVPILTNCILWGSTPPTPPQQGHQIVTDGSANPILTNCDVQGGADNPGYGGCGACKDLLPLFVAPPGTPTYPWNDPYYLSQSPLPDSPCLDAGWGSAAEMGFAHATTRTDLAADQGPVDMGYHHPMDCAEAPNGIPDDWEIADGSAEDCNHNGVPDACEGGAPADCAAVPCPGAFENETQFNLGTLINVSWDGYALSRNAIARPLPYIWVPCSGRGTVLRVCTEVVPGVGDKGDILGEYLTAPDNPGSSPSRTSVDLDGNVWVGNRADNDGQGSVTRVGLVIGGVRCDASGTPNEFGEYIKPLPLYPLKYNTCVDRNTDGLIKASRGLGNRLAWPGLHGSVSTAEDECILSYVRVTDVTNIRHVSVNAENNVWVGSFDTQHFALVRAEDGGIISTFTADWGGYGGLVDCNQVLWSVHRWAQGGGPLLRYEAGQVPPDTYPPSPNSYGLGIDFQGNLWNSRWSTPKISKFDSQGALLGEFPANEDLPGSGHRGVAVTVDPSPPFASRIWIANSAEGIEDDGLGHTLTRLDESGNVVPPDVELHTDPDTIQDGFCPTGLAVDHLGKVWTTCRNSNTVKCVDPATNQVDYTLTLPDGSAPYSYSDMTGQVTLHTSATGTWNVIHDGRYFGAQWHLVVWNKREPPCPASPGTSLTVEVRASDFQTALPGLPFNAAQSGRRIDGLEGRYIEVRVRFKGECPPRQLSAPSLCRLYVEYGLGDMNCDGLLNFDDIDPLVLALSDRAAYEAQYPNCDYWLADINSDGAVNFADIDAFVALLTNPPVCD